MMGGTREERFWSRVDRRGDNECWPWKGALQVTTDGKRTYGRFHFNKRTMPAHRASYEINVGPIPEGLVLDHLCRNQACCNPSHLEPVTDRENILRGTAPAAENVQKTHCPKGHPLSGENVRHSAGARYCLTCCRASDRLRKRRDYYAALGRSAPA